jgi:hypothetical protein
MVDDTFLAHIPDLQSLNPADGCGLDSLLDKSRTSRTYHYLLLVLDPVFDFDIVLANMF